MDERRVFPVAVLLSCLAVSDTPFSHLAHSCHMWIFRGMVVAETTGAIFPGISGEPCNRYFQIQLRLPK
jgi:hypothetical protein